MRLLAAAMVLLLAACGGGSDDGGTTTGDAGPDGAPDGTTGPGGTDSGVGQDVSTSSFCHDDSDCSGAGEVCDCHGDCVVAGGTACTEDRNCGVPRWCNTCTGFCEDQVGLCQTCETDNACLDQGACLTYRSGGMFCGLGCVTDAGCPQGFACLGVEGEAVKQCVARSGACEDLGLCQDDRECPVGQICSETTRACAPGCVEDGQCQSGQVCVGGRCGPPCSGDGDCTPPAVCEAGGKCRIPGACSEPNDCPEPETYCSRQSGMCEPGCQIDADCKDAAKICTDERCVDKGCQHNFECAFGNVCDQASGDCVPFDPSEPHCASCDAEASDNASCPDPNICVRFQDEEEQPLGDFCLVPCKDDPIDRCPSGWQCQNIGDPESGEGRFFCARPCYSNPVGATP